MKKSFLLFFLFAGLFFNSSYSQAPLAAISNPNYIHDKLHDLGIKSYGRVLPDSLTQILKNYAQNKNLDYMSVLKNSYVFQVLYNENLSINDRLFACKYYILSNSGMYQYAPLYLLKEIETSLSARKQKN